MKNALEKLVQSGGGVLLNFRNTIAEDEAEKYHPKHLSFCKGVKDVGGDDLLKGIGKAMGLLYRDIFLQIGSIGRGYLFDVDMSARVEQVDEEQPYQYGEQARAEIKRKGLYSQTSKLRLAADARYPGNDGRCNEGNCDHCERIEKYGSEKVIYLEKFYAE
jgi:hypothetical protein